MLVSLKLHISDNALAILAPPAPDDGEPPARAVPRQPATVVVEVDYEEEVKGPDGVKEHVARSERYVLVGTNSISAPLPLGPKSKLSVSILRSDGTELLSRPVEVDGETAEFVVNAEDAEALLASEPAAPTDVPVTATRSAQLVPVGSVKPDFAASSLAVAAIASNVLESGGLLAGLGFTPDAMSAIEAPAKLSDALSGIALTPVHVGIDGRFKPFFPDVAGSAGWLWWLNGPHQILGFVNDDLSAPRREPIVIPLPPLTDAGVSGEGGAQPTCGNTAPADFSEIEAVNNPAIFSEDPGAFCKPFSNPERVLSEKSFAVVARVQQPEIGAMGSTRIRTQHLLDVDAAVLGPLVATTGGRRTGASARVVPERGALADTLLGLRRPTRHVDPPEVVDETKLLPSGRGDLDAKRPVQWEDDIAQYQATTVALGHIIEFRVRSRSNGYSLGNVASTLTLAPRQTKRIQKIAYERLERNRRQERTQLTDSVSDEVRRERDYHDTVSAYLNEWATGSSESGTSAAAGGFGFAVPPIVGGVGGGASKAWSTSEQEGGRNTTAAEQQRLRDSIRRHADALRRFESTVVTEVAQEETVTGTTEVVRNANYGHSLTVIYYQILRHLKVTTEFGGVRECLFVPFSIKPFTLQRAYRWREAIETYIRSPRFGRAIKHLRDVLTHFQSSPLVPGTRAHQPLTYVQGSFYLNLSIARPKDSDDGKFTAANWQALGPYLSAPAFGIWSGLMARVEAEREAYFQSQYAPRIAAMWASSLRVQAANGDLNADCTLATKYGFNQAVRVDFTVPAGRAGALTRELLTTMQVVASAGLPPGSVANVTRMSLRYGTATFERNLDSREGTGDLLDAADGHPDSGAQLNFPLNAWDNVDEQKELENAVAELIEHLNEHVEYYHKAIWWCMDRDRLLMMLDGFYVPGTDKVSIASVVDREPVAIIGNCLVYRVGAAAYIGFGKIDSPAKLYNLYAAKDPTNDPILISLPTDGLYAQTIMDECLGLEEHKGSIDWVLEQPDPELGTLDPALLMSRRADPGSGTQPTELPGTIINLQNAPDAPAPTGLQGALDAVTNANAFRDMAGLAGTQANAMGALQTASSLATNFGNQAAALKLADIAGKEKARQKANEQMAAVKAAQDKGLISAEDAQRHANGILEQMYGAPSARAPHENEAINKAIEKVGGSPTGGTVEAATSEGAVKVEFAGDSDVAEADIEREDLTGSAADEREELIEPVNADDKWIILVGGYNYLDYSAKTYPTYCRNRAAFLLSANPDWKADPKIRFLLIDVGHGKAFVDDRAKGSLVDPKNWRFVGGLTLKPTGEDLPLLFKEVKREYYHKELMGKFVYPTDQWALTQPPFFSILEWYKILGAFGRSAPGTILEATILSHGNPYGPVLINTWREHNWYIGPDPFNVQDVTREREGADLDGRADSDFREPDMSDADKVEIHAAFAPGGRVWLWGCAEDATRSLIQRLYSQPGFDPKGSTPDSATFKFDFDKAVHSMARWRQITDNDPFLPASGSSVQSTLGEFKAFLERVIAPTYASRLTESFDVDCFATALGTTSRPDLGAKYVIHHVAPAYEKVVQFFENYMGRKRDSEGRRYVNYKK